jgi:hypothetical protein
MESIPDLKARQNHAPFERVLIDDPQNRLNVNYYRELANYEFTRRLFRPVRLVVKNIGQVAANDVRTELTIPCNHGVVVVDPSDLPKPPKKRVSLFEMPAFKSMRTAFVRNPGEVKIDKNDDRFKIEIDCGDLQPGRRVWSGVFFMGKGVTGELTIPGEIFAENLSQPKSFTLTVSATVKKSRMDVSDLRSLPVPKVKQR